MVWKGWWGHEVRALLWWRPQKEEDTRVLLCLFLSLSPYVRKGYVRTGPEHRNLRLVNSERLAGQ